jgi:hypothetical protein
MIFLAIVRASHAKQNHTCQKNSRAAASNHPAQSHPRCDEKRRGKDVQAAATGSSQQPEDESKVISGPF